MKKTFYILIQAALLTTGCCNTPADDPLSRTSDMAGWSIDVVAPGCVWYNYTGFYLPTGANQTINVLEIDLSHGGYSLSVVHSEEADSLSAFALRADAFAGINGSYFEPDVSFVKTDGKVRREVTVDKTHTRYWKHEGAFFLDPARQKRSRARTERMIFFISPPCSPCSCYFWK